MSKNMEPKTTKPIDPTRNVIALVKSNAKMQRDLRVADHRFNDARYEYLKEIADLRAANAEIMRSSDLDRLDKTRQVDVLAATASAAALATAVQTLAATSDRNADALRNLVNTTAATMAKQTSDLAITLSTQTDNQVKAINSQIAELQKSMYQGAGKSSVADPMMVTLVDEVKKLGSATTATAGQSKGMRDLWGWIIGGAIVLYELISRVKP